ncbi:hypothetical protein OROGR_014943 [Orobanche gracilis]
MYRGGELGYVRLVANTEKLTVSYVGNHDGETHDVVEMLASGRVFNGLAIGDGVLIVRGKMNSRFSWYVKVGSILVLGAFLGYVSGFVSRWRRDAGSETRWTAVKSDET